MEYLPGPRNIGDRYSGGEGIKSRHWVGGEILYTPLFSGDPWFRTGGGPYGKNNGFGDGHWM